MKKFLIRTLLFFTLFSFLFSFNSCNKDDDTPQLALYGIFDTQYQPTTASSPIEMNILFEDDNSVVIGFPISNTVYAGIMNNYSAIYQKNGNTIKFTVTESGTSYNFTGTYDAESGKIKNGTVGTGTSYTGFATFNSTKHKPGTSGESLFKGYWKGKYGNDTGSETSDYIMVFEENGMMSVSLSNTFKEASSLAYGTYTISGNTITATYQYVGGSFYSISGTYDAATKKINGTWGPGEATNGGGTFHLDMKNND